MPYAVNQSHIELLRHAQRFSKRPDEAEDLLQDVLLAAIEAGRSDLSDPDNRKWMVGALRKRALFQARSAVRRKGRETTFASQGVETKGPKQDLPLDFVSALPRGLRTTALLVLTGHTKQEIVYLCRISDAAFRQRISELRKRWRNAKGAPFEEIPGLDSSLPLGEIRRVLLKPTRSENVHLASHDPDGNLFMVCSQNISKNNSETASQKTRPRQLLDTNTTKEPLTKK